MAQRASELERVAKRAYSAATSGDGVLTDWRVSEAVLTPIGELQSKSVLRAIDEGLPVGVYANRYTTADGKQASELLPLVAGRSKRVSRSLTGAPGAS